MEIYSKKANGKLLLTSEYFVLDGASAIALPTKFGQRLSVVEVDENLNSPYIHWISYDNSNCIWGDLNIDYQFNPNINNEFSKTLVEILARCRAMNPFKLKERTTYKFITNLEFNRNWGLGSSSTLIALLADFFEINAYRLLENTFGGSGYDIACAFNNTPIVFSRTNLEYPSIKPISFKPVFSNQLFFVYSGHKQNSRSGIALYRAMNSPKESIIKELNQLTNAIFHATTLNEFELLIDQHEEIISSSLGLTMIKEERFSDYWGCVKSLGAWGGDFLLMTNNRSKTEFLNYLNHKNIDTVLDFHELILT